MNKKFLVNLILFSFLTFSIKPNSNYDDLIIINYTNKDIDLYIRCLTRKKEAYKDYEWYDIIYHKSKYVFTDSLLFFKHKKKLSKINYFFILIDGKFSKRNKRGIFKLFNDQKGEITLTQMPRKEYRDYVRNEKKKYRNF